MEIKLFEFAKQKNIHGMEIVSLLFTLFYFFPIFFYPHVDASFLLRIFSLYCFLLGLLVSTALLAPRTRLVVSYALIVLSTLFTQFYVGTNVFYGFAIFNLALYHRKFYPFVGLVFTVACIVWAAYAYDLVRAYFLLPTSIPTAVLFISGLVERRERRFRKSQAQSQEQLERMAAVAERERIARDLHDVLGHTLTSIALKSQLADKLISAGEVQAARKEIAEVANISSATLGEVREAISGYKKLTIDDRLLQLQGRLHEKGLLVDLACDFSRLNAKAEAAISLVLTEAVTNILRHSLATEVTIYTENSDRQFRLVIRDNGETNSLKMGNGLTGIKERIEELHGQFRILTNEGCTLEFQLPEENFK